MEKPVHPLFVHDVRLLSATRVVAMRRGRWRPSAAARSCCAALVLAMTSFGCAREGFVKFERAGQPLTVGQPSLYPETIEYDRKQDAFLLSSVRNGGVYKVDREGRVSQLVDDPRLCSVLGIAIDAERGRLWAVNTDLGASTKRSAVGPKNLAAVGVYDLATGKVIDYVDLAPLSAGPHLINGVAVDAGGNAYITDSFSPTIYKVDLHGAASVFLTDQQFTGAGVNLNGVVAHPDGYLLVVKKSDGSLFRIPLADPSRFARVAIPDRFVGGDGLTLVGRKGLVVIANQTPGHKSNAAFSLVSDDGWVTAGLRSTQQLGDLYPTTAVLRGGTIYVLETQLDELMQAPPERRAELHRQATIEVIARAAP